jgi:hypothetical protein
MLASFAAMRTNYLMGRGIQEIASLNGGYQLAFALGASFAASGAPGRLLTVA